MRGRKYFWENDYRDGDVADYIQEAKVLMHPPKSLVSEVMFSQELMDPILQTLALDMADKQKFVIIGDYDVDGTSGTAILLKAFRLLQADVDYYIPNRFTDGYGLNPSIVERFHAAGVRTLITVDNGIVAFDAARRAKELGLTLIITDHHARADELPDATHILHPALDVNLKELDICGAAVAFLLAKKLLEAHPALPEMHGQLLQLVALGTIADMMPLDQPWNRALSYHGFAQMRKEPMPLLTAFLKLHELQHLVSDDLSFKFIPCINAVGRIADGNVVVEAFLTTSAADAEAAMQSFHRYNVERKEITETIYRKILETLSPETHTASGFLLVIGEHWHQGVLGIVAQRLMQQVSRPVILLTNSREQPLIYTGSARAFGPYSVKACFDEVADLLIKGGGHQYAGGLSVDAEQLLELTVNIDNYNKKLSEEIATEKEIMPLQIDAWLPFKAVDEMLLQRQEQFEPYGEENKKFVIGVKHVKLSDMQELGKTQQHVKLTVIDDNTSYQIVAFQMYDLLDELAKYAIIDVAIEVQRNYFNGVQRIQYLLQDVRVPQKQIFDYRQRKYQRNTIPASDHAFIVKDVPLNTTDFLATIAQKDIQKIYLPAIPFEESLLYADTIEQKYFIYVYKYMLQKQKINLDNEELYREFAAKKMPKSILLYILRVFFELNFVIIKDNICQIKFDAPKTELANSQAYKEMDKWLALRSTLLTGTIDHLYQTLITQ